MFTRYGKIGAASGFETKEFGYLKKPILMMKPGAFFTEQKKSYAGLLIPDVHINPSVKHSGYTKLLGINWNGDIS